MSEDAAEKKDQSQYKLTLERLPRTIELVRSKVNDEDSSDAADGAFQLVMLDQTKLPYEQSFISTTDWRRVVDAIKLLQVRGAPAIGIAGAAAIALCAAELANDCRETSDFVRGKYKISLDSAVHEIVNARPTAVNLAWACDRALAVAREHLDAEDTPRAIAEALFDFVKSLEAEDEATNRAIGDNGATLLSKPSTVLTHCNAGSLGTAFYGTALGIIYTAASQGHVKRVYADETRPVGQGARLTAWELSQAGVPVTLICDNMAASVMASGAIDAVFVGADRIAANGDVANKIGTYGVAVLAHHHEIPFYVAAPTSTIDFSLETGAEIPIEQRDASEVLPHPIEGVDVYNPAFDVTPANLITKIITERGVFAPCELQDAYEQGE